MMLAMIRILKFPCMELRVEDSGGYQYACTCNINWWCSHINACRAHIYTTLHGVAAEEVGHAS